jgi:hypothetical protein
MCDHLILKYSPARREFVCTDCGKVQTLSKIHQEDRNPLIHLECKGGGPLDGGYIDVPFSYLYAVKNGYVYRRTAMEPFCVALYVGYKPSINEPKWSVRMVFIK